MSHDKQNMNNFFFNTYKPQNNQINNSLILPSIKNNSDQSPAEKLKRMTNSYFPEQFDINKINNSKNDNFTQPNNLINNIKERKTLTKEEMKMMLMEQKFKNMLKQNEEEKQTLFRFINSGINVPVNTLLQYQNVREQENNEKKEINDRREHTRKELKRAQEQLKRELEFSDDDDEVDYKTKLDKLDKKLKKQVAKYKPNQLNDFDFEKPLTNAYKNNRIAMKGDYIDYGKITKNPEVVQAENDIKYLDADFAIKLSNIRKNDKRAQAKLRIDMDQKTNDMFRALERFEQKNVLALEYARDIFENSGSKRLKYLSKRILGGEDCQEEAPEKKIDLFDLKYNVIFVYFLD